MIEGTRIDRSQLTVGPWLLRVIVEDSNARSEVFRKLEVLIEE